MNADQDNIVVPAEGQSSICVHPRSSAALTVPVARRMQVATADQRRGCDDAVLVSEHDDQGAIREDRLVFPIPPGTHWSEVEAIALPQREKPAIEGPKEKPRPKPKAAPSKVQTTAAFGLRFAAPSPARAPKPKRERGEKPKEKACPERSRRIDPQLIAKARELRDRYLEHVNSEAHALRALGKYEVARLPDPTRDAKPIAMLPAAA
jgi:hypothetical protein